MADLIQPGALYYKAQRYCDRARTLRGVLAGSLALAAGAAAYVYFMPRSVDVLLRIGAVIAAAVATGIISAIVVTYGKISSRIMGGSLSLLLGFLTLYLMWVFWIQTTLGHWNLRLDLFRLMLHPLVVWDMISALHETVHIDVGDSRIDGIGLWLVWALEGLAIVGGALGFGILGVFKAKPVCTKCGSECPSVPGLLRFAHDEQAGVVAAVNGRDFASLPQFPTPASVRDPELTIRVASCPLCGETNVLTLSHLAWITNKQGIKSLKATKLVDGLLITSEEARVISALIPRVPEADPDEEPAGEQGATE